MASSPAELEAEAGWWEFCIELPEELANVTAQALLDAGATGTQEDHAGLHFADDEDGPIVSGDPRTWSPALPANPNGSVVIKAWFDGARPRNVLLKELLATLEDLGADSRSATLSPLPEQDWNATWKAGFSSFQLSPRLRVVPSWTEAEETCPEETIQLDPGMAFGTGTHFTTAGCTQLLDELLATWKGPPPTLLDVGTGTGILALAGLRLGAYSAVGVDPDPRAIEASAENARINGLTAGLSLFTGGPEAAPEGTFPIVLANLIAPLLTELAPELCARLAPGASLILSGILCNQEATVIEAFSRLGMQPVQRLTDEEWVALRLSRVEGKQ